MNGYVGYEYEEITVKQYLKSLYKDCYPYFGWNLEELADRGRNNNLVCMRFKRERNKWNEDELKRLQKKFDSYVKEIENMEFEKRTIATAVAGNIGIFGILILGLSLYTGIVHNEIIGIIFAIPGIIGVSTPYHLYQMIRKHKDEELQPRLEQKFEEIDQVCRRVYELTIGR